MSTHPEKFLKINNAFAALMDLRVGDRIPEEAKPLLEAVRRLDWKAIRDVADDLCARKSIKIDDSGKKRVVKIAITRSSHQAKAHLKRIIMEIDGKASEFGVDELTKADLLEILRVWYPEAASKIPTSSVGRTHWWEEMGMKNKPQGRGGITSKFRARLKAGR